MHRANSEPPPAPAYFNFATDVFDSWAKKRPDALGLWCVNAGTRAEKNYTFGELAALSRQTAAFLREAGVRPGDRVLLMLPRIPQWWVAMLALIRMGAVPIPATLLLTARDLAYRLRVARVRAVITNQEGVQKVGAFEGLRFLVRDPSARGAGPRGGWLDFNEGANRPAPGFRGERTRSDAPGSIFFTSATTGEPKMVLHTQASYGLGHRVTGKYWLDLRPGGCPLEYFRPRMGQSRVVQSLRSLAHGSLRFCAGFTRKV